MRSTSGGGSVCNRPMKPAQKQHVRGAFRDFAKNLFAKPFGELTTREQGTALTKFYIAEIHNRTTTEIDEDDLEEALIDGANDLGLDLIQRDDNVVHLLQYKYYNEKSGANLKDILHFQNVFDRIADITFAKKGTRLRDKLSELDFVNDTFVLRFVCLGKITGQAVDQLAKPLRFPDKLKTLEDRVTVEYLDEDALTQELRNALSQSAGISGMSKLVTFGARGDRTPIIEVHAETHPSYVMVVPAMQIVQLYKNSSARDSLFTLNIRNFIGSTQTNKNIVKTARTRPNHFFHFNNGISCLAKKVTLADSKDRLEAEGLQVINGAQTVKALVRAAEGHRLDPEPSVLVRITEISKGYAAEGTFTTEVTRYNNTQNVIKDSDFRSNDPIQQDLKDKFNYSRFGRPIDYVPKRTDRKKPSSVQIRLEEFAKVIYSFLGDPIKFSGQTSFLFDESENGGYRLIFGDGQEVWLQMPDEEFQLRSAIWWLADEFGRQLKRDREITTPPIERASLERKWFIIHAARLVLQRQHGEEQYRTKLAHHWRGDWRIEDPFFANLYDVSKRSVMYVYATAAKKDGFIHRNWMRSGSSVDELTDFIRTAPFMGK